VKNSRALKQRLVELGFQAIRARRFESNRDCTTFVDASCGKRDGCCFLTLKCGPVASSSYKIRRELETQNGGERLSRILRRLGPWGIRSATRDIAPYMGTRGRPGTNNWPMTKRPSVVTSSSRRAVAPDQTARQLGYQRKDLSPSATRRFIPRGARRVGGRQANCFPGFA
jgi:hypothetical protein